MASLLEVSPDPAEGLDETLRLQANFRDVGGTTPHSSQVADGAINIGPQTPDVLFMECMSPNAKAPQAFNCIAVERGREIFGIDIGHSPLLPQRFRS